MDTYRSPHFKKAISKLVQLIKSEGQASSKTGAFGRIAAQSEGLKSARSAERGQQIAIRQLSKGDTSQNLDAIVQNMPQGVIFLNFDGTIAIYNNAASSLLALSAERALYNSFWHCFDDEYFGFSIHRALNEKKAPKSISAVLKCDNSSRRTLEVDATFLPSDQSPSLSNDNTAQGQFLGKPSGLLITFRKSKTVPHGEKGKSLIENEQITEWETAYALLAHEIRNPLGGIKGMASLLKRDLASQPDLQRFATSILVCAERLNKIASDLLDISRPLQMDKAPCDLVQLAKEFLHHLQTDQSIDPRIEIALFHARDRTIANIDANWIKSALLNLASNAIQAMADGGVLRIDIKEEGNEAVIELSDTGAGIPPENISKVFSPLFTTRKEGSGLGLTAVEKIAKSHGGTIIVESIVGKGTVFTMRLPL